ncbi:MAG: CTP synthase [Candidatus Zambryskibacteria bacterium]|nr:CTP synthase [Candidatus Zambryskibacteria bacterium]
MKKRKHKYIFVVGGVMSGIGKGISAASIGRILKSKGFTVNQVKVDPYLNVDAGNMNPTEHGEVFVMDSGLETDQDMGNYERFLDESASDRDYLTSGMIYYDVINRERSMGYKGKCVEALPDIIDEIYKRFIDAERNDRSDITVVEIGGTIGDYQNIMFIEAARILKIKRPKDVVFVLVSYLPQPSTIGEQKTRPTRIACQTLNSYGVQTDFIIVRSERPFDDKRAKKLAISCNVSEENIISAPNIESIYDVPINFEKGRLGHKLIKTFGIRSKKTDLTCWKEFVKKTKNGKNQLKIAVVGKYFDTGDFMLSDAYISVIEAVKFSSYWQDAKTELTWINSKEYENGKRKVSELKNYNGIIVPGGFGESGIEGVIMVIKYARENKIPFLGLCYGMQLMTIEFARNVIGLKNANTVEIDPDTTHPVIDIMPEQKKLLAENKYGATMRLGAYPAILKEGTGAFEAYLSVRALAKEDKENKNLISERHRHRYEVNPEYIEEMEKAGLIFSATSPDGRLMEIAELPKSKHPFFLGTQFHPEFQARPLHPHPLFNAFIEACLKKK